MLKPNIIALGLALAFLAALQSNCAAQEADTEQSTLPLSNSASMSYAPPLTFAQQTARFHAEQRAIRMEWNNWIGYSPSRPNMNANYMSNGVHRFYIPSRAVIISMGHTNGWYW